MKQLTANNLYDFRLQELKPDWKSVPSNSRTSQPRLHPSQLPRSGLFNTNLIRSSNPIQIACYCSLHPSCFWQHAYCSLRLDCKTQMLPTSILFTHYVKHQVISKFIESMGKTTGLVLRRACHRRLWTSMYVGDLFKYLQINPVLLAVYLFTRVDNEVQHPRTCSRTTAVFANTLASHLAPFITTDDTRPPL